MNHRTAILTATILAALPCAGQTNFQLYSGPVSTDPISGHLLLVDLRRKKLTGKAAEHSLEAAGMTCNKNGVPFDPEKPTVTSGIRLGSPAATTRGFGPDEFRQVGRWIARVLDDLAGSNGDNGATEQVVLREVEALCRRFPVYPDLG